MGPLGDVHAFVAGAAQLAAMASARIELTGVAPLLSILLASFSGRLSDPAVLRALFAIAPFNGSPIRRRLAKVNIRDPAAHGLPLGACPAGELVLADARATGSPDKAVVTEGRNTDLRPSGSSLRRLLDDYARPPAVVFCGAAALLLVLPALLGTADKVVGHALGFSRCVDDLLGVLVQHVDPA